MNSFTSIQLCEYLGSAISINDGASGRKSNTFYISPVLSLYGFHGQLCCLELGSIK